MDTQLSGVQNKFKCAYRKLCRSAILINKLSAIYDEILCETTTITYGSKCKKKTSILFKIKF